MAEVIFVQNPNLARDLQHSDDMQRAVDNYADEIATKAQDLAPYVTGQLHDSIHTETLTSGDAETHVVAGAPYAQFVEFGTSSQRAEPYLRPAADAVLGRAGG